MNLFESSQISHARYRIHLLTLTFYCVYTFQFMKNENEHKSAFLAYFATLIIFQNFHNFVCSVQYFQGHKKDTFDRINVIIMDKSYSKLCIADITFYAYRLPSILRKEMSKFLRIAHRDISYFFFFEADKKYAIF